MLVELIGPPGSGKTYLAASIAERYDVSVLRIKGRLAKCAWGALFFTKHPLLSAQLFRLFWRETKGIYLLYYKLWIVLIEAAALEAKAESINSGLIDEGLLQALYFGLYERPITENDLTINANILSFMLGNRRIVFVTASSEERKGRMVKRGRIPRQTLGSRYSAELLDTTNSNEEPIKDFLHKTFKADLIEN